MKLIKRLIKLVLFFIILISAGAVYYISKPSNPPTLPYDFNLQPGTGLKVFAHQMKLAGLVENEKLFVLLGRALKLEKQIKFGNYEITKPLSMYELLQIVNKGKVTQSDLTIIEGWTFKQFRQAINASTKLNHDSLILSDAEILQRIGATETHPEGLFYPDTYIYPTGSSDLALLKRAYQTMQRHLKEAWNKRDTSLPFENPYQALILASIVEKETGKKTDRGQIAAVFVNRLRKGMLLQTDPTVIYGMGEKFDGNIRKKDLLKDTPYNTYLHAGLTPTPISLPGKEALQATLHPDPSQALYFVARGDGTSQFSKTLIEHNQAVARFQLHQK